MAQNLFFFIVILLLVRGANAQQPDYAYLEIEEQIKIHLYRAALPAFESPSSVTKLTECQLNTRSSDLSLSKRYLNSILKKLVIDSKISKTYSDIGHVCIAVPGPEKSLSRGPNISYGVMTIPLQFILLAQTEAEIAFILAHELSHHLLHHRRYGEYLITKGIAKPLEMSSSTSEQIRAWRLYNIETEREADEMALKMIFNSGYALEDGIKNMKILRGEEVFSHIGGQDLVELANSVKRIFESNITLYTPVGSKSEVEYRPVFVKRVVPGLVVNEAKLALQSVGYNFGWLQKIKLRILGNKTAFLGDQ